MKKDDYLIAKKTINNSLGWPLFIEGYPYKVLNVDDDYIVLDHYLYANEYAEYKIDYILENFIIIDELKRDTLICQCHSLEHQYSFYYSNEDGLYCEPHLSTYLPFYKRLIVGIKYIFGYKSKFGAWDEFLFKLEDLNKLEQFIKIAKDNANKNDSGNRF
jgi:hypothetical protein